MSREPVAELIVVRHGETSWNADGILQGQEASSLNEVGKDQARAVAELLASKQYAGVAIYSSDLERALDTANVIAHKCGISQVTSLRELRERHLGKLQGLPRRDARRLEPEAFKIFLSNAGNEPIPGGGESRNEFYKRSISSLESIAEKHIGERVIIVTHGGVLKALHYHVTGQPSSGRALNTSINIFKFKITDQKVWTLHSWGDVSHLTGQIQAKSFTDQDSA